jgi:HEAT repeat protein
VGTVVTEIFRDRWAPGGSELDADELLAQLDDPDPEIRMHATIEIEPEGEALDRLADLLLNDPDPRVRAASAANLESADSYGAVEALVVALDDPDPDFVLEVIASLEFAGDASNTWHLEPLLEHPDPRVREAAADAIEFLAD